MPCPKCGRPLPADDSAVCPHCDAIVRPDPDGPMDAATPKRHPLLMLVASLVVLAVLWSVSGGQTVLTVIGTGIYVIAFSRSARRVRHPAMVVALSLLFWLGLCAMAVGIFFIGCLIVASNGGFGG